MSAATQSNRPSKPCGHQTWYAKNSARLTITPTTAAVMAVNGAVKFTLPWVDSTSGQPARMKMNEGRKVNQVTSVAAKAPARNNVSGPNAALAWPPTNPTKATTMMSGPGVVSPNARPSIICAAVNQPNCSTAPWYT